MPHWYSGLLPYPILFPVQLLILCVQVKINLDVGRDDGFSRRHPRNGRFLKNFSHVYAAAMLLRYAPSMTHFPDPRWIGIGTFPSAFHLFLAAYLSVLGCHLLRDDGKL